MSRYDSARNNDKQAFLVLVMSEQCVACQNFKRKALPDLEKELRKNPKFEFIVLNFPEMMIPARLSGMDYHPQLRNGIVQFYPTFILFPAELWKDSRSELKGVPKYTDQMLKTTPIDYSKKSILTWVDETLQKDPLFTQKNNKKNLNEFVIPTLGTYTRFHLTKINSDI